jgi:ribose transport system substrate-binding protein
MNRHLKILATLLLAATLAACSPESPSTATPEVGTENIRVAYVTNGIDPFWTIAEAGAKAAAEEFNVICEVRMPPDGLPDQIRMIEALLSNAIDGIAISPIDAANQVGFINEAAARTNVITHDSDAPGANRLCFIGMDNYKAGRECGKLIKEVMPDGGSVMIFVGRLEQLNAQQRRQGVIDELLDRPTPEEPTYDPINFATTDGTYTIAGTRTDDFNYAKAKSNAEDTIAGYAGLGCMVGLFAYNTPACLAAVREAGKTGAIKLASFDEAPATLEGIASGEVHGTISQQPYLYGYHSIRILAGLARGDQSVLPEDDFLEIEVVVVRKDNVEEFQKKLAELKGE